jgi:hypothetical protein
MLYHHYFNLALDDAIRKAQKNQVRLKLNYTHQLLVYADDANLFTYNINTTRKTQKL